jgi:hypothetical protein
VGLVLALTTKFGAIDAGWALKLFLVWVGVLVLAAGMRSLSEAARVEPSVFEAWLSRTEPVAVRPQRLKELERLVEFASLNAFDLNYRLRVVLREIASERLGRRGLTLDEDGARRALGEQTWAFLAPSKASRMATEGPGWKHQQITEIVEAVEGL